MTEPPGRLGVETQSWAERWPVIVPVYSVFILLCLSPLLFYRVDPMWDAFDMAYPAFAYLADSLREGRFPLWDPYTNCGVPFHADPASLTLNPVAIFCSRLFDSPVPGFHWFWVFYWWLGGFGMLWLSRHYGAAPLGGLAAASAYALSGFFVAHAEHTGFIIVAACLPWLMLCAERAVSRASLGDALLAGAALGFCSYTGYPGLTLFSCLTLAVWLMLRFLPASGLEEGENRSLQSRALWIALTLAIMTAVYLVVWSPSLNAFLVEGRGYTDRVEPLPMARATGNEVFTWTAVLSLFFPYVTIVGRAWMGCDISMSNAYIGMLGFPLALFWIWRTGLRRTWWLVAFALAMFVISLGGEYGLRTLLYYLYPPTRYMQFNAPFRLFWILPLCLAAGLGFTRLLRDRDERRALLRLLSGWAMAVAGAGLTIVFLAKANGTPLGNQALLLFAPGALVLAVAGGLLWWWQEENGLAARLAPLLLALVMVLDMGTHLYNNNFTVWNPETISKEVEQDHQRSTRIVGSPPPRIAGMPFGFFNAQQIVKVPLVGGYVTMKSEGFDGVLIKSRFAEVLSGPQRFWLAPGVEVRSSRDQVLSLLAQTGGADPVPAFVDQPLAGFPPLRTVPGTFGGVSVGSYAPERIELHVSVPGADRAFLVSSERYAAGWQAFVDGAQVAVQKVNLYFRGIVVPPGEHTVTWEYRPVRWVPLVWLSYLTLVGTALAGGLLLWRRRQADGTKG